MSKNFLKKGNLVNQNQNNNNNIIMQRDFITNNNSRNSINNVNLNSSQEHSDGERSVLATKLSKNQE